MRRACHLGLPLLLVSCWADDAPLPLDATLTVTPQPLVAGRSVTLASDRLPARGVSLTDDGVSLGGRALPIRAWGGESIEAEVPVDTPGGFAPLVVVVDGRPWASVIVETLNDPASEQDSALPALFAVSVVPDAAPALGYLLRPQPAGPDEVALDVVGTPGLQTWGVAFHVVWDPLQLELVSAQVPDGHPRAAAKSTTPGRLVFGAVVGAPDLPLLSLRFRALDQGERRVSLPAAYAEARDAHNRRTPGVTFAGVTVSTRATEAQP